MRILICGGSNYEERDTVWRTLDQYQENYGPLTVIQGGAPGADRWAGVDSPADPRPGSYSRQRAGRLGENGAPRAGRSAIK